MKARLTFVVLSLILLSGCAATVKRDASDTGMSQVSGASAAKLVLNVDGSKSSLAESDWEQFKQEWKVNFEEQANLAGVPFEMQDGAPQSTGNDGTLLSVYVEDYRFIRPGTRYVVGIATGNAFIESKLTFSDLKTGAVLGTQSANTTSSTWQGIFSPMTNKQVEAIAVDVFKQLKKQ